MLTKQDEEWLNHLSDTKPVRIIPFNPKAKEIFEQQKKQIQQAFGQSITIEHRGATSLGISGKGDIDIYIPVFKDKFDEYFDRLKLILEKPGSVYPYERIRWNKVVNGFEVEIFLINQAHPGSIRGVRFENYLRAHPEAIEQYRKLKEDAEGLSTRQYYRKKLEFINDILAKDGAG